MPTLSPIPTAVDQGFRARALAEGLVDVAYALMDSPLGTLFLAATDQGLVRVAFDYEQEDDLAVELTRLSPRVLKAPKRLDAVRQQLDEYLSGARHDFDLPVDMGLVATDFRRRVLAATARIPFGQVSTYSEMATEAGNPLAVRAAGSALGSNPVPIVVPCHRVLRSDGTLGGYTGGLDKKEFLLGLEGAL
jgi:methylated-DNA-[protein]-cysteine S-methyltransferase